MIEEVSDSIYRISVPLPNNPMRELNSYFIRGGGEELLIDTGFRREECEKPLREGLQEIGCNMEKLSVLLTHMHADHTGLASSITGPAGKIYMSDVDIATLQYSMFGGGLTELQNRFIDEGFPRPLMEDYRANSPALNYALPRMDERFCALRDGEKLSVGDFTLQTVLTPGHTPGHAMFWMEEQRLMFTGDHVLFDITPNITAWNHVEDSLGDYLDSLRRVREYPVELALPGHRESGDYHERIDHLLAHHERRLNGIIEILHETPGLKAYDIAGHMKWKIRAADWESFPTVQKYFAVGECLSHLDHLVKQGQITRVKDQQGLRYFAAE